MQLTRAFFLTVLFLMPLTSWSSEWDETRLLLETPQQIIVYRDANCSCCHAWIEHLEKHHFIVVDEIHPEMIALKQDLGLPPQMASCHTAVIGDYLIEGHVPADDIKRLLIEQPADIKGLSVQQMPVGTPGMEMGQRKDDFIVFSFDEAANFDVYQHYQTDADNQYQPAIPRH